MGCVIRIFDRYLRLLFKVTKLLKFLFRLLVLLHTTCTARFLLFSQFDISLVFERAAASTNLPEPKSPPLYPEISKKPAANERSSATVAHLRVQLHYLKLSLQHLNVLQQATSMETTIIQTCLARALRIKKYTAKPWILGSMRRPCTTM